MRNCSTVQDNFLLLFIRPGTDLILMLQELTELPLLKAMYAMLPSSMLDASRSRGSPASTDHAYIILVWINWRQVAMLEVAIYSCHGLQHQQYHAQTCSAAVLGTQAYNLPAVHSQVPGYNTGPDT